MWHYLDCGDWEIVENSRRWRDGWNGLWRRHREGQVRYGLGWNLSVGRSVDVLGHLLRDRHGSLLLNLRHCGLLRRHERWLLQHHRLLLAYCGLLLLDGGDGLGESIGHHGVATLIGSRCSRRMSTMGRLGIARRAHHGVAIRILAIARQRRS